MKFFYGPVKLGESKIVIGENEITANVYTTGPGNIIYPYKAIWKSNIDAKGCPIKSLIFSKDPFKEREKEVYFYYDKKKILYKQLKPSKKEKEFFLSFPIYDELTAFVTSFNLNYTETPHFKLPLFVKGERHYAELNYQKKLFCTFNDTSVLCHQIQVLLPEKSELLKRAKEVIILLYDKEKIPLELRGALPVFGTLTAKLKLYTKN